MESFAVTKCFMQCEHYKLQTIGIFRNTLQRQRQK